MYKYITNKHKHILVETAAAAAAVAHKFLSY